MFYQERAILKSLEKKKSVLIQSIFALFDLPSRSFTPFCFHPQFLKSSNNVQTQL